MRDFWHEPYIGPATMCPGKSQALTPNMLSLFGGTGGFTIRNRTSMLEALKWKGQGYGRGGGMVGAGCGEADLLEGCVREPPVLDVQALLVALHLLEEARHDDVGLGHVEGDHTVDAVAHGRARHERGGEGRGRRLGRVRGTARVRVRVG